MGKIISKIPSLFKPLIKPKPSIKKLEELLKPGGKDVGVRKGRASPNIRTVARDEYDKLKRDALDGAKEVPSPPDYKGKWFERSDGSIVGLRKSEKSRETLEVVKSFNKEILDNGYKVHVDGN